jgi:hypothetical protein
MFDLLISMEKVYVLILTTMGWATFWAIFSKTHLVTLLIDNNATATRYMTCSMETLAT